MNALVCVVGSANLDVVIRTPTRPRAGETVLGTAVEEAAGGKGLNQALAAARVAATAFVGAVGDGADGDTLRTALVRHAVDVSGLRTVPGASGRAYVEVTPDAENSIVVLPLANERLTAGAVGEGLSHLVPGVVLAQCEVPQAAVAAAAAWCDENGARFVLNLSPVRAVPDRILEACDPLVVNVAEGLAILGADELDAATIAERLADRARSVVVTAGSRGAFVARGGATVHLAATPVVAIDTTGAGDAFAGTLAALLAAGSSLDDAAARASDQAARVIGLARADR